MVNYIWLAEAVRDRAGWLVKREKYKVTFLIHSSWPYSSRRGLKEVHNQSLDVKCMGKELGSVLTK